MFATFIILAAWFKMPPFLSVPFTLFFGSVTAVSALLLTSAGSLSWAPEIGPFGGFYLQLFVYGLNRFFLYFVNMAGGYDGYTEFLLVWVLALPFWTKLSRTFAGFVIRSVFFFMPLLYFGFVFLFMALILLGFECVGISLVSSFLFGVPLFVLLFSGVCLVILSSFVLTYFLFYMAVLSEVGLVSGGMGGRVLSFVLGSMYDDSAPFMAGAFIWSGLGQWVLEFLSDVFFTVHLLRFILYRFRLFQQWLLGFLSYFVRSYVALSSEISWLTFLVANNTSTDFGVTWQYALDIGIPWFVRYPLFVPCYLYTFLDRYASGSPPSYSGTLTMVPYQHRPFRFTGGFAFLGFSSNLFEFWASSFLGPFQVFVDYLLSDWIIPVLEMSTIIFMTWFIHMVDFSILGPRVQLDRVEPSVVVLRWSLFCLSPFLALLGSGPFFLFLTLIVLSFVWVLLFLGASFIPNWSSLVVWGLVFFLRPAMDFFYCFTVAFRRKVLTVFAATGKRQTFYASFIRFYAGAYVWAITRLDLLGRGHNPVVATYTFRRTTHIFRFRDDLPTDPDQLYLLGLSLFMRGSRALQRTLIVMVTTIFVVYCILLVLKFFVYRPLRFFILYLWRVLLIAICLVLVPDATFVLLLSGLHYTYLFLTVILPSLPYTEFLSLTRYTLRSLGIHLWFGVRVWERTLDPSITDPFTDFDLGASFPAFTRERYLDVVRRRVNGFFDTLHRLRLPEFVQAQWQSPTPELLQDNYRRLAQLGWPIDPSFIDSIRDPRDDPYLDTWASLGVRLLIVTNHIVPVLRAKFGIPDEMRIFWESATTAEQAGYYHSFSFTSILAEIRSLARYATGNIDRHRLSAEESSEIVDDVWELVKAQFAESDLASPEWVFRNWEKNFNMGFGFSQGEGKRKRQARRKEIIEKVGGKGPFLSLWKRTFREASSLVTISPAFTKMETLKLKKKLAGAVRTPVGSSFTHHILSTVFSYMPNHHYKVWETPMKVGMSFNGQNFGRLWESLSRHSYVWAGDMTAFDSTVPGEILAVVAEVRKLGFSSHKDFHRIASLIDIAYEQLLHQPIGLKSTGSVFGKDQGFTTGHSSTSPDNSLALVIMYMFAWRRITGLRAREFAQYNTLINFGDDHVLGWEPVFGWTPWAASRAMAELGIVMRDEGLGENALPGLATSNELQAWLRVAEPSLSEEALSSKVSELMIRNVTPGATKISFLAKVPLPKVGKVLADLNSASIDLPFAFATCHDRERLLGKIKGEMFANAPPAWRRSRLLSYMDLCAHHEDVFLLLEQAIHSLDSKYGSNPHYKASLKSMPRMLSYSQVLQRWYSEAHVISRSDATEYGFGPVDVHSLSLFDQVDKLILWLSDFTTIWAPRVVNSRWETRIIDSFPGVFSWPLALIISANRLGPNSSVLGMQMLSSTPYRSVIPRVPTLDVTAPNLTSLYVRHWMACFLFSLGSALRSFHPFTTLLILSDRFVGNLLFTYFARVPGALAEPTLDLYTLAVVGFLSFVTFPPLLDEFFLSFSFVDIPLPSVLMGLFVESIKKTLATQGSVDLQPFWAEVEAGSLRDGIILSAPTGIGKSTKLMAQLVGKTYKTVLVVVPRVVIAESVGEYMARQYPDIGVGIHTSNVHPRVSDRLIYLTPQAFLLGQGYHVPSRFLVVVDEAHVDEIFHQHVPIFLRLRKFEHCLVTATPPPNAPYPTVRLPCVPRYQVKTFSGPELVALSFPDYLRKARDICLRVPTSQKVLVFIPSVERAREFALTSDRKSCLLSSVTKNIDPDASLFVATSVADAGITLPDVRHVVTSDVEISVKVSRFKDGVAPSSGISISYYYLSKLILTQRRGRTGRTSDGYFYNIHLTSMGSGPILDSKPNYSTDEIHNELGQALTLFPEEVVNLPPNAKFHAQREAARFWGREADWWKLFSSAITLNTAGNPLEAAQSVLAGQTALRTNLTQDIFWYEDWELPDNAQFIDVDLDFDYSNYDEKHHWANMLASCGVTEAGLKGYLTSLNVDSEAFITVLRADLHLAIWSLPIDKWHGTLQFTMLCQEVAKVFGQLGLALPLGSLALASDIPEESDVPAARPSAVQPEPVAGPSRPPFRAPRYVGPISAVRTDLEILQQLKCSAQTFSDVAFRLFGWDSDRLFALIRLYPDHPIFTSLWEEFILVDEVPDYWMEEQFPAFVMPGSFPSS